MEEFESSFRTTMAKQLSSAGASVRADQIKVLGYRGGSIIVDFSVVANRSVLDQLNGAIETISAVVESAVGMKIAGLCPPCHRPHMQRIQTHPHPYNTNTISYHAPQQYCIFPR
jgi:hypothetical protein